MLKGTIPIGIDFGNNFSSVAYWDANKYEPKIIPNEHGENTTPSVVAFTDTECLIGTAAVKQACDNPENTIFNVKRLLGKSIDEAVVIEEMKT